MSLATLRVACVASLLAACLLVPAPASSLRAPPLAARRLRGGFDALDDDDDEPAVGLPLNDDTDLDGASSDGPEVEEPITDREPPERPPNKALTKPQILEKLNAIPVFCLLTKDDGIVGMKGEGDDETSCCWFTDPLEARALLKHMSDNNPETELHMGCHSLGAVFSRCGGWPKGEEPEGFELPAEEPTSAGGTPVALKLKGSHGVTKEVQPQLIELMKKAGIDPGSWQLPVFFCDELQSRSIVPIFLNPTDLATTWVKAGRSKESVPEKLSLMDIRMLVQQMQTDSSPWNLIEFVGSPEAVQLAKECQDAANSKAAA